MNSKIVHKRNARSLVVKKPIAFCDLETTGRTIGLDRIIEIGIIKVTPDGRETQFQTRVNPEMRVTKEATKIHGITNESLLNQPRFAHIAPRLADFLAGADLGGYNILNFDLPMLQSEFRRVGLPLDLEGRQVVDVMSIYVQKEPRDLKAAYRFYCGIEHTEGHSAIADARASWQVLQGQLNMYPDLPNTPERLIMWRQM